MELLHKINDGSKILIFVEKRVDVDFLTRQLRDDKWNMVGGIHGQKQQREREQIFGKFKSGENYILVATDVASRGLDVKDIKYVLNYDLPSQIEDYVHRIGRTGRAGAKGVAFSMFTSKNAGLAGDLTDVSFIKSNHFSVLESSQATCALRYG